MCKTSQLDEYLKNDGTMCINYIKHVSTAENWLAPLNTFLSKVLLLDVERWRKSLDITLTVLYIRVIFIMNLEY